MSTVPAALTVIAAPAHAAPPADLPEDLQFVLEAGATCDFAVLVELQGKSKVIEKDDGRIEIAPGLRATVSRLDASGDPVTSVTQVIGGTFHKTDLDDGSFRVKATGRNALVDLGLGFVVTSGNYIFFQTPAGVGDFAGQLTGAGRTTDLCEQLG